MTRDTHWQDVYTSKETTDVSWYQPEPEASLRLIQSVAAPGAAVVDIGGGASFLADRLAAAGYDVTVLDVSDAALESVRARLDSAGLHATLVAADVVGWQPGRTFDVWHDRAAFHFLTDPADAAAYIALAAASVPVGGYAIIATFAEDGPTHCSGLEVARHTPEQLAARFASAFALVASEREVHRTPWDAEQAFSWVVLRRT